MQLKKNFRGGLLIIIFLCGLYNCRKISSFEGPDITKNTTITKDTTYKKFQLADFENNSPILYTPLVGCCPGTNCGNCATKSIVLDTSKYINYYYQLTSIGVKWSWYLGGILFEASKFNSNNNDKVFHFAMDPTNVTNTFLNIDIGGSSDFNPQPFVIVNMCQGSKTFSYNINIRWTGRKRVSIPFDAFTMTNNKTKLIETINSLNNINNFSISLYSDSAKNTSTNAKPILLNLDNIVVTQNKVYQFN